MAGTTDISSLRVLADVVEPVKDYNRWDESKGPIDFHSPLNRMIDAVYPESDTARAFAALVQSFVQSGGKDQNAEAQIRSWLTIWRDNDAKLHPVLAQSFLLQEDEPISQNLSAVAAAGLQALDYIDKAQAAPSDWLTQQQATINQTKKPVAGLLLMVAAPVEQLVTAVAAPKS
jgi:hexosaminidase